MDDIPCSEWVGVSDFFFLLLCLADWLWFPTHSSYEVGNWSTLAWG
jgi:hypothetical protein